MWFRRGSKKGADTVSDSGLLPGEEIFELRIVFAVPGPQSGQRSHSDEKSIELQDDTGA